MIDWSNHPLYGERLLARAKALPEAGCLTSQHTMFANQGLETCVSLNDRVYLYFPWEKRWPGPASEMAGNS